MNMPKYHLGSIVGLRGTESKFKILGVSRCNDVCRYMLFFDSGNDREKDNHFLVGEDRIIPIL